jgi:DNA-binding LacI/PurR family transcriptional regulator
MLIASPFRASGSGVIISKRTVVSLDCHVSVLYTQMGLMMTAKRRLTSFDVARASGVSRATVSYVLNNDPRQSIPPETRERVLNAARKLGYRPFAPARNLRAGRSGLILGVLQFEQVDPGLAGEMHYLESELAARGFHLIWHIGTEWAAGVTHPAENLAPDLVLAYVDRSVPTLQEFLRHFDVPILSLINPPVLQDAGRAQVACLTERGKRRIIFAAPERNDLESMFHARLEGVREECARLRLPAPTVHVVPSSRDGAREAIANILDQRKPPFGICCYNDEVALAVLAALSDARASIPEAIAVMGCDDIPLAQLSIPPLTTISWNNRKFLDLLIENAVAASKGEKVGSAAMVPLSVVTRDSA